MISCACITLVFCDMHKDSMWLVVALMCSTILASMHLTTLHQTVSRRSPLQRSSTLILWPWHSMTQSSHLKCYVQWYLTLLILPAAGVPIATCSQIVHTTSSAMKCPMSWSIWGEANKIVAAAAQATPAAPPLPVGQSCPWRTSMAVDRSVHQPFEATMVNGISNLGPWQLQRQWCWRTIGYLRWWYSGKVDSLRQAEAPQCV